MVYSSSKIFSRERHYRGSMMNLFISLLRDIGVSQSIISISNHLIQIFHQRVREIVYSEAPSDVSVWINSPPRVDFLPFIRVRDFSILYPISWMHQSSILIVILSLVSISTTTIQAIALSGTSTMLISPSLFSSLDQRYEVYTNIYPIYDIMKMAVKTIEVLEISSTG
jgi:hypothetical protein